VLYSKAAGGSYFLLSFVYLSSITITVFFINIPFTVSLLSQHSFVLSSDLPLCTSPFLVSHSRFLCLFFMFLLFRPNVPLSATNCDALIFFHCVFSFVSRHLSSLKYKQSAASTTRRVSWNISNRIVYKILYPLFIPPAHLSVRSALPHRLANNSAYCSYVLV
jgi:hypothetical protein